MFGARTAKDSRLPASALRDWLPKGDSIVPGLEKPFKHRVDFLSLHVRGPRAIDAKARLGFKSTPHIVLLGADEHECEGRVHDSFGGAATSDTEGRLRTRLRASRCSHVTTPVTLSVASPAPASTASTVKRNDARAPMRAACTG